MSLYSSSNSECLQSAVFASKRVFVHVHFVFRCTTSNMCSLFSLNTLVCHMCYTPKMSFTRFCIGWSCPASVHHFMVKVYACFCSCSPSPSFQAYVYDIRSSSYLHKLQKFSDTVLSVRFNPATPEVRTFSVSFEQNVSRTCGEILIG